MKIVFNQSKELQVLESSLKSLECDNAITGIMILLPQGNNYNKEGLDNLLRSVNKRLIGGVFPAFIYGNNKYDEGFLLVGFDIPIHVSPVIDLSEAKVDFETVLLSNISAFVEMKTVFVFTDGLSKGISRFIDSLFLVYGLEFNYIGGGAGSLSLEPSPCIISNSGVKQNCVILAGIDADSGVGVKHGWQKVSGPYKITLAQNNKINEIDYQPAFDVYKSVVEKHSQRFFNDKNFFEIAKAYPLGINKYNSEHVVRDLLFVDDKGCFTSVGDINKGAYVDILTADNNSLIKAAGEAVKSALNNLNNKPKHFIFFIDCVSRVIFLEDDFSKELQIVVQNSAELPVFGVLSIGEIANSGYDFLEFFNKTSVVVCI